jgi:glutaredoxin 3
MANPKRRRRFALPAHSKRLISLRSNQLLNSSLPTEVNKVSLVVYTKPGCPYCQQARDYYNSKGIGFIDRDAQTNREYRAEMFKYSGDDPTVPCIVEDGKYLQSGWGDPLRG